MRTDGTAEYYMIQHLQDPDHWVQTALAHLLFRNLTHAEKLGVKGDAYRKLLRPQDANSELWQRTGINGYAERTDAIAMFVALQVENPDVKFRIVRRTVFQHTEVIV